MKPLIVYTDGSFIQKPCSGGIGLYFPNNEISSLSLKYNVPYIPPTSQRCELLAIKYAFVIHNAWFNDKHMEIYTDSEYSINCLTTYYKTWINNGWTTNKGKPVKNQDLLLPMTKYLSLYFNNKIQLNYVPAHSKQLDKHSLNNRIADAYARRGHIMSDMPLPSNFEHLTQ
jgi:ribonuclease HI